VIYKRAADAERLLAAPPPALRACLIYGRDRSGVRERGRLLAGKLTAAPDDPFNVVILTDADVDADPARLPDELSALSLFGGRRLVRLQLSGEKAGADRTAAEVLKQHLSDAFNAEAFLLIETGALTGASTLRRIAEAADNRVAVVPVYEDDPADTARITREALAAEGVRLSADALALFTSRLPRERGVVRQEIERLVLFVGPESERTVSVDELQAFLGGDADASLFEAAVDAFGGRLQPALSNLQRAFNEGDDGAAAIRAAGGHGQKLRRIQVATHNGASLGAALKGNGVFWKQEREMGRHVQVWSAPRLDAVQQLVLTAEADSRSTGSPNPLLAERLFLTIGSLAKRAGL
jgi:DNA polymerase-3 subunit delta